MIRSVIRLALRLVNKTQQAQVIPYTLALVAVRNPPIHSQTTAALIHQLALLPHLVQTLLDQTPLDQTRVLVIALRLVQVMILVAQTITALVTIVQQQGAHSILAVPPVLIKALVPTLNPEISAMAVTSLDLLVINLALTAKVKAFTLMIMKDILATDLMINLASSMIKGLLN